MNTHSIQRGETLAGIARRYGVTVQAVAAANGITDPNRITAGRVLTIPARNAATAPAATLAQIATPAPAPAPVAAVPVAAPASGSWLSQIVANIAPAAQAIEAAKYQRALNAANIARIKAGQPLIEQAEAGNPYSATNPETAGVGGAPAWFLPAAAIAVVGALLLRPATPKN